MNPDGSLTNQLLIAMPGMADPNFDAATRKAMGEASEQVAMQQVKMSGKVMQGVRMMETLKSTGTIIWVTIGASASPTSHSSSASVTRSPSRPGEDRFDSM